MKKILIINSLVVLIGFAFAGCEKEAKKTAEFEFVSNTQALLKINYVSAYTANPSVQLEIDDKRVSNLITSRTPFPGGGFNTNGVSQADYLFVSPGMVKLSAVIPKRGTDTDSITLFSSNIRLDAKKNYTVHITDTSVNTKVVLLTDNVSEPDTGTMRYTFVHLIPNVAALDLYHNTTLVASNVPYLGSVVFNRPTFGASPLWNVRETGTGPSGTILATYSSTNTVQAKRVFTAFALGYKGSTDAVKKPYISFLLNR